MARLVSTFSRFIPKPRVLVVLWLALAPGHAAAQPPSDPREANPERPTVATHAYAVLPGIVEIEAGGQWQSLGPGRDQLTGPILIKIGLARRLQLDIAPGLAWLGPDEARRGGIADSALGLKWQVAAGVPILADVAVETLLKLPTGNHALGTGTGTTDLNVVFISSRQVGPVELDVNFGYTRRSGDGTLAPTTATLWTVSTGFPVAGPLQWTAELFGYPGTRGPAGSPPIVAFLTGPTFRPRPSVVFDAGLILNVEGFGATALYAGVTWNIGRLPGFSRQASARVTSPRGWSTVSPDAGPTGRNWLH